MLIETVLGKKFNVGSIYIGIRPTVKEKLIVDAQLAVGTRAEVWIHVKHLGETTFIKAKVLSVTRVLWGHLIEMKALPGSLLEHWESFIVWAGFGQSGILAPWKQPWFEEHCRTYEKDKMLINAHKISSKVSEPIKAEAPEKKLVAADTSWCVWEKKENMK